MKTKFVANEKGSKTTALIPIPDCEDLPQDIYSAVVIERRGNEKTISLEKLNNNG